MTQLELGLAIFKYIVMIFTINYIGLLVYIVFLDCERSSKPSHHDSNNDSFYKISNRK